MAATVDLCWGNKSKHGKKGRGEMTAGQRSRTCAIVAPARLFVNVSVKPMYQLHLAADAFQKTNMDDRVPPTHQVRL